MSASSAAWLATATTPAKCGEKPRALPLLPIQRYLRLLRTFEWYLDPLAVDDCVLAIASELQEDPRVVRVLASALVRKVKSNRKRYRPTTAIGSRDENFNDQQPQAMVEPVAVSTEEQQRILTETRQQLISMVEIILGEFTRSPVKHKMLLDVLEILRREADISKGIAAGNVASIIGLDVNLPADSASDDARHKRNERMRKALSGYPDLIEAYEDYEEAKADFQFAIRMQEEGHDRFLA
jgi:hypothetical protein